MSSGREAWGEASAAFATFITFHYQAVLWNAVQGQFGLYSQRFWVRGNWHLRQCQNKLVIENTRTFIQFHYSWILKTQDGNGFATLKCICRRRCRRCAARWLVLALTSLNLCYTSLCTANPAKSRWLFRVPTSMFCFFSELLQCRVLFLFNATQLIALVLCFRPFLSMFLCRGLTFLTATCNFPEVICCRPISWPYWTDSNSRAAQCNPKLKSVGRTWAMDKNALLRKKAIPCNSYDRHVFLTERVRAVSEGPPNYQVAGTSAWYQVLSRRDCVSMLINVHVYQIVSKGSKRFALNGGGLVWSCLRAATRCIVDRKLRTQVQLHAGWKRAGCRFAFQHKRRRQKKLTNKIDRIYHMLNTLRQLADEAFTFESPFNIFVTIINMSVDFFPNMFCTKIVWQMDTSVRFWVQRQKFCMWFWGRIGESKLLNDCRSLRSLQRSLQSEKCEKLFSRNMFDSRLSCRDGWSIRLCLESTKIALSSERGSESWKNDSSIASVCGICFLQASKLVLSCERAIWWEHMGEKFQKHSASVLADIKFTVHFLRHL